MVGNRTINRRLERSAHYFRISETQVSRYGTQLLPLGSCYRFKNVRHLYIHFKRNSAWLEPYFLLSLPSVLETLSLRFYLVMSHLILPSTHEYASSLDIGIQPLDFSIRNSVINFGKKFPCLRRLLLNDTHFSEYASNSNWSKDQLAHLLSTMPLTLEELTLSPLETIFGPLIIPLLPSSLLSFSISVDHDRSLIHDTDASRDLNLFGMPPSATKIQLLLRHIRRAIPFQLFPPSLKSLNMRIYETLIDAEFFQGLPQTLTQISIETSRSKGSILGLPQSLVCLNMLGQIMPSDDLDELGAQLDQRTLPSTGSPPLNLDLSYLESNMIYGLPRGLKVLTIDLMLIDRLYTFFFRYLPATLTELSMSLQMSSSSEPSESSSSLASSTSNESYKEFSFLCSLTNLLDLDICVRFPESNLLLNVSNNQVCSGLPEGIPTSLEKLRWNWNDSTVINDCFLSRLPSNLKSLSIGRYTVESSAAKLGYPKHLRSLHLQGMAVPDLLEILPHLPSSLRELQSFSLLKNLSPLEFVQQLPSSMTSLVISLTLTEPILLALPRTLQTLIVSRQINFADDSVKFLPRSLKHLELSTDNSLTDACVPLLPPSLTIFAIPQNSKFSILGIANLPRSITAIRLRIIKLPDTCPFKTVHEAMNALPPDVKLICITSAKDIRIWAISKLHRVLETDG